MKRFVLFLVLMPIIAALVTCVAQAVMWVDPTVFRVLVRQPGYALWSAYVTWLLPALVVATADRLLRSYRWLRRLTIAAAAYVSTLPTEVVIYDLPSSSWRWGMLLWGPLLGAIASAICSLLLDHVTRERIRQLGSRVRKTIQTLRRWPEPG
jgi:hypothetical protein